MVESEAVSESVGAQRTQWVWVNLVIVEGCVSSPIELGSTGAWDGGVSNDIKKGTLTWGGVSSDRVNFNGPVDTFAFAALDVIWVDVELDLQFSSLLLWGGIHEQSFFIREAFKKANGKPWGAVPLNTVSTLNVQVVNVVLGWEVGWGGTDWEVASTKTVPVLCEVELIDWDLT